MLDPFTLPFVQHALWELLLLAVGTGVLGTWIVLRGLAFFAHGVAAATFPGLVVASGLGVAGPLGAASSALVFALSAGRLGARGDRRDHGPTTAMLLVGALAIGVILASNVFPDAVNLNSLLFGSLLLIDGRDLWIAGAASALAVLGSLLLGTRWLAIGFDVPAARALGVRPGPADAVLLVLVASMAIATLSAVGSLLAAAVMVIPAATVRPWVSRMLPWQAASVLLTALIGAAGLWLSTRTNAPPGATIAVLSGALFAVSVLAHAARHRTRGRRRSAGLATAVATLAGVGLAGCGTSDDPPTTAAATSGSASGPQVAVVATTAPVADLVRNVGGDAIELHQILVPGTDPHEYEPRPKDVAQTASASVAFASGLGLDAWIDEVLTQSGSKATVVRLGDHVPERLGAEDHDHDEPDADDDHADHDHDRAGEDDGHGVGHDHGDGSRDPHWWHDPENAIAAVDQIRDALTAADPAAKQAIAASAAAYRTRLERLDDGVERCFAAIPKRERKIVTSHDALGYFAEAYDLTVVGAVIPSRTTRAQASAADVARLARLIRSEGVRAVFPESSVNPKVARALAQETGATSDQTLYGDTLGEPGSDGDSYIGIIRHNADAIVRGITGGDRGCTIAGL